MNRGVNRSRSFPGLYGIAHDGIGSRSRLTDSFLEDSLPGAVSPMPFLDEADSARLSDAILIVLMRRSTSSVNEHHA